MKTLLSIDYGTQSVRVAIIDLEGNILDIEKREIEPYFSKQKGWAEQDPDYFWEQMCIACRNLMQRNHSYKETLQGLSLTTQRATMINVDKDGIPLRPAISWVDERRAEEEAYFPRWVKTISKWVGLFDTLNDAFCECEWNWLRQNQAELVAKTHKYLFLSGYLNYKLSGLFRDSVASMVGYIPFDYKKQKLDPSNFLLKRLMPIPAEVFPELVQPSALIGSITEVAATETDLPVGLKIFASGADKATEILGLGVNDDQVACLSFGTMATVNMTLPKYKEIIPFMPAYPAAIEGKFNTEMAVQRGFWLISWFKEEFARYEKEQAEREGVSAESLLNEFLLEIPAGSEGLLVLPYWSPAARNPGKEAKGALIGFQVHHTRKHMYKAVVEGILMAMKQNLMRTEKKLGKKVKLLRVGGGGSVSDAIMQMTADIFGLPAQRVHTYEVSSLGAAICTAVGLKVYENYNEAGQRMVREGDTFYPKKNEEQIYQDSFLIFEKLYPRLRPIYNRID